MVKAPYTLTRRELLMQSLSLGLLMLGCRKYKSAPFDFLENLRRIFPDREAARRVGEKLLKARPDLNEAGDELYTMFVEEGNPGGKNPGDWIREKHRQDLAGGEIYTFDNWVLSRTEVLLLASQV
ncbi:MAG: hypothetical protein HS115_14005 [Spirochaetales bacterium]|nr:hypothetical protein [Spirochaetales bacterium]